MVPDKMVKKEKGSNKKGILWGMGCGIILALFSSAPFLTYFFKIKESTEMAYWISFGIFLILVIVQTIRNRSRIHFGKFILSMFLTLFAALVVIFFLLAVYTFVYLIKGTKGMN